jgi:hypothetical protein
MTPKMAARGGNNCYVKKHLLHSCNKTILLLSNSVMVYQGHITADHGPNTVTIAVAMIISTGNCHLKP